MCWCVQTGKSSRSGVGWSEVTVTVASPLEEAGVRNSILCGDRFGVVGRGIAWDRHCVGWGGGGGWHKALVVGSVSLWRRLLASRL